MLNYTDLIGVPYLDCGRDPSIGLDCYGLMIVVFARAGIALHDVQYAAVDADTVQTKMTEHKPREWRQIDGPIAPCALAIRNKPPFVNHTGVYIGDGKFLHTLKNIGVHLARIDSPAWRNRIEGYYLPR